MKKEAMLYEKLEGERVHCFLCSHHCKIKEGKNGVCGVRKNEKGTLFSLVYQEVVAEGADPIEKKPFYHFLPGSLSYSIATVGCNFQCGFCQNWQISQASKRNGSLRSRSFKPEEVVKEAKSHNCKSISYTYTEPTVFLEYAQDISKLAKKSGLYNTFVTNGYMTKEALDVMRPTLDACSVDLKSFSDETYKKVCKATLKPVLDSIRYMKKIGMWVEITTLVIPGINDSDKELKSIAEFIADTGKEIPWHISRFHPDYEFNQVPPTPAETLKKAESIGKNAGLKYVYLGNTLEEGNTYCYNCKRVLIKRTGYGVAEYDIGEGKCAKCGEKIEGVW